MNIAIKGGGMRLFLTKRARSVVVAGVCVVMFTFSTPFSMADDYRWIESLYQEGEEIPFEPMPVDPRICKCYERNLRYFAKRNTPMSCDRPIAPFLKERIKNVEWEDLDPDQYPALFRAIATWGAFLPGTGEDVKERHFKSIRERIANKVWVFRRARLALVGRIRYQRYRADPESYWIVQYGPNDFSPDNPSKKWRCEPTRGGVERSYLQLYLVSEAKHDFTTCLTNRNNGSSEGQHLRIIDNRLFVENIDPEARIELIEVDTSVAWGGTICIFEFKKSK